MVGLIPDELNDSMPNCQLLSMVRTHFRPEKSRCEHINSVDDRSTSLSEVPAMENPFTTSVEVEPKPE